MLSQMARGGSKAARILGLGLIVSATLAVTTAATGSPAANGILNEAQATDATGDSGTGPDLSSLAVTSYADGTISFSVAIANRTYLESGESVQVFVDLNDDGQADLNLSVWPSFQPSYLARWTGSGWENIRQLPELIESPGSLSVRLGLSELQSDGAVPVAPKIQVSVASYSGGTAGTPSGTGDDWIPSPTTWFDYTINPAAAGTATTGTTTTPTTAPTTTTTPAPRPTKPAALPVTIESIPQLSSKLGADVKLHVLVKSGAGAARLFKVCTEELTAAGSLERSLCRSTRSGGGTRAVPFTITYRMARTGIVDILIVASAGAAKTTSEVDIDVSKA